ncbi:hypothetical protein H2248_005316 [Termitomyces sp. 'cryptogamus']|nr:hypothetical protein H2248_005316 [Termitomyces sp. 'cryptogamus']
MTGLRSRIGSSAFLPSILAYVRNSSSGNLPLDPGIFQAILQCMVAGDKYLILLAPEEDVSLVAKLTVWTLSTIFDLSTHKAKIGTRTTPAQRYKDAIPPQDPSLFLRSLFLPSHKNDGGEPYRLPGHSRSRSNRRHPSFMRPASAPNDPHHSNRLSAGTSNHSYASDDVPAAPSPPIIAAPQPRRFLHANTDPLPLLHKEEPEFPHALVLHGLERASVAEQTALAQVLTRRQVVFESARNVADPFPQRTLSRNYDRNHNSDHHHKGTNLVYENTEYQGTWNLPDDFILVSVCPWNSRERPKIHRSMLDLFGMSSIIYVQTPVRDAWKALPFAANTLSHSLKHSYSNPPTPAPPQSHTPPTLSPAHPSTTPHRASRSGLPQQTPFVPKQLIPRDFIVSLQKAARSAYVSSQLSLYMSDLFSAVRHHPKLDGTFLTAKSMNDANDLARAGRVLGIDPTGGELLRCYSSTDYEGEHDEDSTRGQLSSEMHEYIASGSESVTLDIPRESISLHSAKDHDTGPVSVSRPEDSTGTLFVSEAAIARVVPRAVTHRLRVRDGPSDEVLAGAIFGANFESNRKESSNTVDHGWDTRYTIKDILVEILAEV